MNQANTCRRRIALRYALAGAAAAGAGLAAPALAQARWSVDTSASAGVSTNPYLETGPTAASLTGTLDVRPSLVIARPLTTLTLSGDANVAFYSRGRSTNETFSVNGGLDHKLSERTSLNASVSYLNSIVGGFIDTRVPVGQPVVQTALPLYVNDPALGGLGQRRQAYQASVGIGSQLSPVDRINVNLSGSANRLGGIAFSDFNYVAPSVSYSRAVGAGFDVGASMMIGFTDYIGTRVGDATIYQPQFTASRRLGRVWTIDLGAGVGIAQVRNPIGPDTSSTSFNGSANLCRRDERWNACFSASRQTLPSAYQGVRAQTSISASVGYRMNEKDDLSLTAAYSRTGAPLQQTVIGGARSGSIDYLNANSNFSHRFGRALSGFVTAGVNQSFDSSVRRNANFTALVGLSYRFGGR